jgi:cation diffusion facilitator family transporter
MARDTLRAPEREQAALGCRQTNAGESILQALSKRRFTCSAGMGLVMRDSVALRAILKGMPAAPGAITLAEQTLIGRNIAFVSVSVGIVLAALKIFIGYRAHSTSVLSDGLEASGDVLCSAIVYFGLWLAGKPADKEHPYGHGRYEALAGLAVGGVLLVAGAAIFWHGVTTASEHSYLPNYAVYPLVAAVILKIILAALKFKTGRRISSTSLETDAWHDVTDLLSTAIALVAVGFTLVDPKRFGNADQIGGVLIGLIVTALAIQVMHRTIDNLLDTMPDSAKLAEIRAKALLVHGALGIEKCFARRTGLRYHVDLHLEVDPSLTVRESHEIATRVRIEIKESLPWVADVLVHVEPSPVVEVRKMAGAVEG